MYDLIVIGAGWAGISACMEAGARGLTCALIDKGPLGGTCLNTGCIPTKVLIQSAELYSQAKRAAGFGIEIPSAQLDFRKVQERKQKLVATLGSGIGSMIKGTQVIQSSAEVIAPDCVRTDSTEHRARWILVATGSRPAQMKDMPFDGNLVLSSDDILNLSEPPRSLLIVGGGVIGCEFAGLFSSLGTRVTIVELTAQLLPGMDRDIAAKLTACFKKKKIDIRTSCDARTVDRAAFEKTLVCVGRRPCTQGFGLEETGVALRNDGACTVDDMMRTNIPSIFAAGDCTGGIMLAHFAAFQGRRAVKAMTGITAPVPGGFGAVVPGCVFTDPQIASVGLTEDRAAQLNVKVRTYRFDFMASGMARILNETDGYVKIIVQEATGKVVGAGIVGPKATELISTLTVAVQAGMTVEQLRDTILPHPTLSEAITEALK